MDTIARRLRGVANGLRASANALVEASQTRPAAELLGVSVALREASDAVAEVASPTGYNTDDDGLVEAAERADRDTLVDFARRILKARYSSDDGSWYDHVEGCGGEPTCPGCWSELITHIGGATIGSVDV